MTKKISPISAVHIVTRNVTPAAVKAIISKAHALGVDTVILGVCWFGSTKLISMPWVTDPNAWTPEDIRDVVSYTKSLGMEVVPQIKLLSGADNLFVGARDDLLYNRTTYDPSNEGVYDAVFSILNELIYLFDDPKAFHIGHDEVNGWRQEHYDGERLNEGDSLLPASMFLYDVVRLNDFLTRKGIETWMWGDMLISRDEFPTMKADGALHFNMESNGYGRILRSQIPKNIVICDWHYRDLQADFPSLKAFAEEGFRVLGGTWLVPETIDRFTKYASEHSASGMISCLWYYVQRDDQETIDTILGNSSSAFVEYFEDG